MRVSMLLKIKGAKTATNITKYNQYFLPLAMELRHCLPPSQTQKSQRMTTVRDVHHKRRKAKSPC